MATDYHGYPVPLGTAAPFVHLDIKALADAVDKDIPVVVNDYNALTQLAGITNLKALVKSLNYKMFIHNGTTWQIAGGVMGHAGRTAGFQNGFNSSTQLAVQLNSAQVLRGGMTFDAASYALVMPATGLYRVTAQGMFTGASGNLNIVVAWKNNSSTTNVGGPASGPKPDGNDVRYSASAIVALNVGDKIGIVQQSAASSWGTTGYDGAYVEAELIGD